MAEEAQARVQHAVDKSVNDLDKAVLRALQAQMHRCSLKCCDDRDSGIETVHRCLEDCSRPLSKAQTYVQGEMNNFQERLQRCVLQCQDNIRDRVTPSTTETQLNSFRGQFESCVIKCADEHVQLLPTLFQRMKEVLSSQKYQL